MMLRVDRRRFLGGVFGIAAAAGGAQRRAPNILLIFSDDHAFQAISAYGRNLNHTPNIDRIGREGIRFDNCLVTNSICAPSRAVVLTGKYSHLNGVLDNRQTFDGAQQTLPKLLQNAGYQTAIIGKWHLKSDPTGFNHWEVLPGQGNYYNPDFLTAAGKSRREGYVTDLITDLSLDWLKNGRDPNKPFLLMCQHKAPHRNWMPAPEKLELYEDVKFPEPPNLFDDYEHRASPAHQQEMEIGRHMTQMADLKIVPSAGVPDSPDYQRYLGEYNRMNPEQKRMWDASYRPRNEAFFKANPKGKDLVRWKYQRYMQDYLRCISSVDDSVGRLLRHLDAANLAENTIVVYASDQGFYLGEHGWFDKRWMYEESIRTPLLVRWPGVTAPGSVSTSMTANLDFPETFLDAAGAAVPSDMQGRSLVPLLRGQVPADWRKSFYYHYYEKAEHHVARHYGVRTDRYTLVHYYESNEWELFDRQKDPREMRSVYSDSGYAGVVAELKIELARLRKELKVPDKDPDTR
jgi:arylsulfatase A-like enzyme